MTTHNGRGQDGTSGSAGDALPASTTPYEGVVLPANGDPWTPQQQRQVQSERDRVQPPVGQPWGRPWGPGSEAAQAEGAAHGDGTAPGGAPQGGPGYWGAPQQNAPSGSLPLPPEGTPARPSHPPSPPTPEGAGPLPPATGPGGPQGTGGPGGPGPMPLPDGPGAMPSGSTAGYARPEPDAYGQQLPGAMPSTDPYGQPGPGVGAPEPYGAARPAGPGRHAMPAPPTAPPASPPPPPSSSAAPQGGVGDSDATQMLPPFPTGQPLPGGSVGPDDGTQLLPQQPAGPVGGGADSEATQYLPPMAGGVGSGVGSGVGNDSEATQMLPPMSAAGGAPTGGGQGAEEPGERRPLPEFDNLFRSDAPRSGAPGQAGSDEPGSTQSLPVFDQAAQQQPAPPRGGYGYPQPGSQRGGYGYPQQPPGPQGGGGGYGYPQPGSSQYEPKVGGRAARRDADRGRRRTPPWLLIGGGLAGVAAIGLVVGLLLANGGDGSSEENPKPSSAPAGEESPAPDPAEAQAKKLDALLADSNNSRSAVVRSVQNIRACKSLGKAAADLRAAAKQRTGLVRRLGELKTDRIPDSAELNSALKSAWRSSASADTHYAAWADQAARKKGCHKGKAKPTKQLAAGNRASGSATIAKKKAARLWNPTAKKYGLEERPYGSL
ncbi:hypothetical protein ACH4RA_22930 [Streptomyces smyrnaeus]|uniref:hypothetical protein n=1 Tax=Streptomyces smyrnaeus TaxID=1387713 RepID=UPI0037AAEE7B